MKWRFSLLCACVILATEYTIAQPAGHGMPPGAHTQNKFLFIRAMNFIAEDPSQSRVDVLYRLDENFFVAVKNTDRGSPHAFKRRGEILIELIDSLGVSKARDINRFAIGAKSAEHSFETSEWYQGIASFYVPPGLYTIVVELNDLESERKFLDKKEHVQAQDFSRQGIQPPVLFVGRMDDNQPVDHLVPQNYGADLLFGQQAAIFIEVPASNGAPHTLTASYGIARESPTTGNMSDILADTVQDVTSLANFTLARSKPGDSVYYKVEKSDRAALGIIIPFPSEQLPLRKYTLSLDVVDGSDTMHITHEFRMVWPDMPFSLRDVEFALRALRYITTEDELDSLESGSFEQRMQHLEEFWKPRDQTPHTAYNEVMVQYYRRVDYAMRTFSTLHNFDGSKSDRGKVFILYGPPSKTERTLDPESGFQEVWLYENLNKKFIFVDRTKSGNYTLVSTQSL